MMKEDDSGGCGVRPRKEDQGGGGLGAEARGGMRENAEGGGLGLGRGVREEDETGEAGRRMREETEGGGGGRRREEDERRG